MKVYTAVRVQFWFCRRIDIKMIFNRRVVPLHRRRGNCNHIIPAIFRIHYKFVNYILTDPVHNPRPVQVTYNFLPGQLLTARRRRIKTGNRPFSLVLNSCDALSILWQHILFSQHKFYTEICFIQVIMQTYHINIAKIDHLKIFHDLFD